MKSRFRSARKWLLFWTLFIGIGAVGGALCMLIDPSGRTLGMDAMLPFFQVLPFADVLFQDFVFSGWALLVVNGLSNLMAAWLMLRKKPLGVVLGGVFGLTLILWICIQFYMFPLNFMSTAYFLFGLFQMIAGYAAWVFMQQEQFAAKEEGYPNIGADPSRLVVYFSRMGYVRRLAMEEADRAGAQVYEIQTDERTQGTPGFWWCGRYGMHRWDMPIRPIEIDLEKFDHVTLCCPIWVFGPAGPMRAFCRAARGKIREEDIILCHFQGFRYAYVADELDSLLGLKRTGLRSCRCRMGRYHQL